MLAALAIAAPCALTAQTNTIAFPNISEISAGAPGAKVSLTGNFPVNGSNAQSYFCFVTNANSAPIAADPYGGDPTQVSFTVPASSIQNIPPASFSNGAFNATIYAILDPAATCDGTFDSNYTNTTNLPIFLPTLFASDISALQQPNPIIGTPLAPVELYLQGSDFVAGLTTVTFTGSFPAFSPSASVPAIYSVKVDLPVLPAGASTITATVCTNTATQSYCTNTLDIPLTPLYDNPGTLVAAPNPTTPSAPVTLQATFGSTATVAGIPTGNVTFTDGANTLGTAPLKLAAGQFVAAPSSQYEAEAGAPAYSQVVDFNKDGLQDLLINDNNIHILTANNNLGSFTETILFPSGIYCSSSIGVTAADLNGDGYPDLAILCTDGTSDFVLTYLNQGDGSFAGYTAAVQVPQASLIAAGDVDKDGKVDLVVADPSTGFTTLFGDGTGNIFAVATSPANFGPAVKMSLADLNADGYPDLILLEGGPTANSTLVDVFQNKGTGNFGANPVFTRSFGDTVSTTQVFTVTPPGSSYPNLIAISGGSSPEFDVILNNQSATLGFSSTTYTYPIPNLQSAAVGDFNGDGYPDIAVFDGSNLQVYPGQNGGLYPGVPLASFTSAASGIYLLGSSDPTHDGYADLFTVATTGNAAVQPFITSGTATASLSGLLFGNGTHNLGASTPGNFSFAPGTAATTLVSASNTPTVSLGITPASPVGYSPANPETITAQVDSAQTPAATGSIQFVDAATATVLGTQPLTQISATSSVASLKIVLPAGNHSLIANYSGDATYTSASSSATPYLVSQSTPTINWAPGGPIFSFGTPLSAAQLNATATFAGQTVPGTFTYTPPAGTVLSTGPHTLSVTFTPTDTVDFASATGSASVFVLQGSPSISWTPNPASIGYGTPLSGAQLDATAVYNGATVPGTFSYNPAAGTVLAAGPQPLSVTFTPTDTTTYAPATGSATITVAQATPTIIWTPNPFSIPATTPLSGAQLNAVATFNGSAVPGTFSYNPAAGAVLAVGPQTLNVTFTPTDITDFTAATGSASIVIQAPPSISWTPNPATITYGTPLSAAQLNATASFNGTTVAGVFSYTPSAGTVLTAGPQSLSVTFTPTDPVTYSAATGLASITVAKATPAIAWTPSPASIPVGAALSAAQLNATASFNGTTLPGSFVYNPAVGTVLPAGPQTLGVTFTPTDTTDFIVATGTANISVSQGAPTITWTPNPASIVYGTALSAAQLNATATYNGATVPGTFTYNPVSGTVLTVGTQTLGVTFTPLDTTTYAPASGSTSITVTQATPAITWAPVFPVITAGTPLGAGQLNAVATSGGNPVPGTLVYTPPAGTVLGPGLAILSVALTPTDTTDFTTATGSTSVTVQAQPAISWTPNPASIPYGTALAAAQLNATAIFGGNPVPGTFAYSPALGTVLPAGPQSLSVTFTPTDAVTFTAATGTANITITKAAPTIAWTPPAPVAAGTPLSAAQLNATATGIGGIALPGVFTYTPAAGAVLPVGINTLNVSFAPTDAVDYATATSSVPLTVNAAATTTTITSSVNPALFGQPVVFTVGVASAYSGAPITGTVSVFDGQTLLGTSATPNGTVTVSVLTAGGHNITAVYSGDTNFATSTSTPLVQTIGAVIPVVAWPPPAGIVYGTRLSAAQLNATASAPFTPSVPGTFTYTPALGTLVTAGTQTLSVTFTPADPIDFTSASGTVNLVVAKATPVLTWPAPAPISAGTALSATQLNATAADAAGNLLPGLFAYTPASGTVLPVGPATLNVGFTPTDVVDYTTASTSVPITVNAATSTVAVTSSANPSQYGQTIVFTITITSPSTGIPITGSVNIFDGQTLLGPATVAAGSATFSTSSLTAGTHSITAVYAGNGTFSPGTSPALVQVVSPATTVISWPQPASVPYGTTLSATQLNATASTAFAVNVPGTFVYAPAAGTLLTAGRQTLSVIFTPTDIVDFKAASGSVILSVTQIAPTLTWPTPAGVVTGTVLSSTQLNASATGINGVALPGTFVYTPAAGTTVTANQASLSVTFTPTDVTDYTTATTSVPINVIAVALTSLTPNTALLGDPAKTITLTGTGFVSNSVVMVDGAAVPTTFVNPTTLTAVIPASGFTTVHTMQVLVNDPTQAQTSNTLTIPITAPPVVAILQGPSTVATGTQPTVNFQLTNPYPVPITGTATLTFVPAAGLTQDPTILFSNGTTTLTFTVPANTTITQPVLLQSGSVAGTIRVTLVLNAGGVVVTPAAIQPLVIAAPAAVPGITNATLTRSGNSLTVAIFGYSNIRQVDHINFHFIAAPGQKLATTDITIDGAALFGPWYSGSVSPAYGSAFEYDQIFNIDQDATVVGQVQVNLVNTVGTSLTGTAQ